jgi:four helix bundle protein
VALQTYRELDVWQCAMQLVQEVYALTRAFPDDEKYGLSSQLRRAAVSVPSNVAEGYGRSHRGDYLRSLSIARGSLMEVETQLILAGRLGFAARDQLNPAWSCCQRIGRMLRRLMETLSDSEPAPRKPR